MTSDQSFIMSVIGTIALASMVVILFFVRQRFLDRKVSYKKSGAKAPELPLSYETLPKLLYDALGRAPLDHANEVGGRYAMLHARTVKRLYHRVGLMQNPVQNRKLTEQEQRSVYKIISGDNLPRMDRPIKSRNIEETAHLFLQAMADRKSPRAISQIL